MGYVKTRLVLFLIVIGGCNQIQPTQLECVKYTSCYSCVSAGCGFCEGSGCYSFKSASGCPDEVGFAPSCQDSPWPQQVITPPSYGFSRDGGR